MEGPYVNAVDLHNFDEDPDPQNKPDLDPHQKSDTDMDSHQSEKLDLVAQ